MLCRSGWSDINYVYRHETNKPIYRVEDKELCIDVTEDHSLFNVNKEEIKPTQITQETKLEMNVNDIHHMFNTQVISTDDKIELVCKMITKKHLNAIPVIFLNSTIDDKKKFLDIVSENITINNGYCKTVVAGINYIKKCVNLHEIETKKLLSQY